MLHVHKDLQCTQNVCACNLSYKQIIFKFCLINIPTFLNFITLSVYFLFYSKLFSQIQKCFPLKYVWFVQGYSIFLVEEVQVLGGNNLSI